MQRASCLALIMLWIGTAYGSDPVTLRYTIFSNGQRAGSEVDTFGSGGQVDSSFEFNDRGRGPKVTAHYRVREDGLPVQTDVTGNDYFKAPVDEHFLFQENKFQWKSTAEQGESAKPGFYVSVNGPAMETSLLVRSLLKAKGPVALLPAGEAHLEKLTDATITDHGERLHVTEYAITGLSFEPQTLWLDDDLQFFGVPGKWFAVMREGWDGVNDQLYALDRKAQDARYARLAKDLSQHPGKPVAIVGVRLFDAENATIKQNQTVVVDGKRIVAAGDSAQVQVPANAMRIDGAGKTLLPGLFDMHAHVQPIDGLMNIASGVTTVRDMGNDIEALDHLQKSWADGTAIGPRVWKAGLIDGRGPYQAPTGIFADTKEEALAAVKRYADLGYIQIKLYSSLKPELVPPIAQLAHEKGLRLSGHVPNGITAADFVRDGADEVQHINFIFLNFLAPKVKDTRSPERFTAVGEYGAKLDLQSKEVNDFIELLKQHHTTVDVTLATFEPMFMGRPKQASPDMAPILDRLPAQVQRSAFTGGLPVTSENDQLYKDSYTAMLRMTKRMYDAGIPILAGTDALAGVMLHRELELEVKAGIPAAKALQIATWNAARLLKQEKDLGSIAPGKMADLLLVEGNPDQEISSIRRCRLIVKDGVLYDSARVYEAAGMKGPQ